MWAYARMYRVHLYAKYAKFGRNGCRTKKDLKPYNRASPLPTCKLLYIDRLTVPSKLLGVMRTGDRLCTVAFL